MGKIAYELLIVKKTILRFMIVFFIVFGGLFFLTVKEYVVYGKPILIPVFGSPTLVTQFFLASKSFLVPAQVPIVALGPVSSFMAPLVMAFLVTFLLLFPYGLYMLLRFLRPALYHKEQQALNAIVLLALVLFYLGCAMAYFVIIPKTFSLLYSFASPIGVAPFFALDDFISSVFLITIVVGLTFLLPVVLSTLTRFNIVPRGFWLSHWRGALLSTVIFSAIITPDGSGVTMIFLAVPLSILYGAGAVMYLPDASTQST